MTKTNRPKNAGRERLPVVKLPIGKLLFVNEMEPAKNPVGALLVAKADLCVAVAQLMIPKAPEELVTDCATTLMYMSSSKLIETYAWLVKP